MTAAPQGKAGQVATVGHTPGPWEVSLAESPNHGTQWGGYWQIDAELDAVACNQFCYAGRNDPAVSMANARLIAASPKLLEELQALVTAVRFADPPKLFNGVLCHEARVPVAFIEGAEAAIALAQGQS